GKRNQTRQPHRPYISTSAPSLPTNHQFIILHGRAPPLTSSPQSLIDNPSSQIKERAAAPYHSSDNDPSSRWRWDIFSNKSQDSGS
ncbi:hypothetical protein AKJ16_DCAP23030, partial [Drosera capensis]